MLLRMLLTITVDVGNGAHTTLIPHAKHMGLPNGQGSNGNELKGDLNDHISESGQ